MPDENINYKECGENEFSSDLKEVPVLSFDEELMDNFDESLLEEEEAIIDFVEEERNDKKDNDYRLDRGEAESFYNFHYINKKKVSTKENKNKVIQDKEKHEFLKLEDLPLERYETAKLKEKGIEKEINNINKEGFYFFNYEEDNNNQKDNTDNNNTKAKESEAIENIVLSKESVNIDDMLIKDEEAEEYKYQDQYKEDVLDNHKLSINEENEEKESHIREEENNKLENITTTEKEQQDETKEKSLKKIASSIKYAGLSSYEDYKGNKIKDKNKGIKELITYFNILLKELPNDKKELFTNSEEYKLYNKIQKRLGIKVEL